MNASHPSRDYPFAAMAKPVPGISNDWQEMDYDDDFSIVSQPTDDGQGGPVTTPSPTGVAAVEPSPKFTLPIRGLRPEGVGPPSSDDNTPMMDEKDEPPAPETAASTCSVSPPLNGLIHTHSDEFPGVDLPTQATTDSSASGARRETLFSPDRDADIARLRRELDIARLRRELGIARRGRELDIARLRHDLDDLGVWVAACRSHVARYRPGKVKMGLTFEPQEPQDLLFLYEQL